MGEIKSHFRGISCKTTYVETSDSKGEYSARGAKVEGPDRLGEDVRGSVWPVGAFSLGEYSAVGHE